MSNIFNSVKGLHPRKNAFSADTYRNDFTAHLGVNIPCYWQEVPPGTHVRLNTFSLVRLQALIAPVMDNIDYYTHFWKVPYRLLENDRFTQFISGEIDPEDYDALFCTPFDLAVAVWEASDEYGSAASAIYSKVFSNGSILDFLGYDSSLFPTLAEGELHGGNDVTMLNWRTLIAYFMLHVEWYMNENVPYTESFVADVEKLVKDQDLASLAKLLCDAAHINDEYVCMLPHGWDKDYFTSALPNVQYGDPVTLPIVGDAPLSAKVPDQTIIINPVSSPSALDYLQFATNNAPGEDYKTMQFHPVSETSRYGKIITQGAINPISQILGKIEGNNADKSLTITGSADLSEATAISINEFRFANALQVFKERRARYGRRRLEYYKGFFDVTPEDLRLQVPKYLGGGRIPINISDIEQTSATSGSSALGHLAGKGTALAGGYAGFSTYCSEETVILGISFAVPHITYAQQLSRFRLKTNDIYDYFNPSFEHLGEQAIKNIEIFSGSNQPDGDFGYTPRYTEYRFHSNEMHGEFKSTLAFWSLGRIFNSQPALNPKFIYMQPENFDRIFAVSGQPNMVVSMLFKVQSIKPVSKYGTPMLLA